MGGEGNLERRSSLGWTMEVNDGNIKDCIIDNI